MPVGSAPVGAVLALCGPLLSNGLAAQDRVTNPHVTISLIPERTAATPGEKLPVALRFEVEEGWHIYWRNPGESGIATSIAWQLPQGWTVDSLSWPVPERYDVAGVTTHVHRGDLALGTRLAVPFAALGDVPIRVELRYGVCRDVCYPGAASLTLALPVGAVSGAPSADWAQVAAIMKNRAPSLGGPAVSARLEHTTVILSLQSTSTVPLAAGDWTFFPAETEVAHAAVTSALVHSTSRLVLRFPLADCTPTRIRGVLVHTAATGGRSRGYSVDLPLTAKSTC